jgi:hypothetical protein
MHEIFDPEGIVIGWLVPSKIGRVVFVPRRDEDIKSDRMAILKAAPRRTGAAPL